MGLAGRAVLSLLPQRSARDQARSIRTSYHYSELSIARSKSATWPERKGHGIEDSITILCESLTPVLSIPHHKHHVCILEIDCAPQLYSSGSFLRHCQRHLLAVLAVHVSCIYPSVLQSGAGGFAIIQCVILLAFPREWYCGLVTRFAQGQ